MYSKGVFEPKEIGEVHDLIRRTTFGTLVTNGQNGLVISHLIFTLAPDEGPNGTLVSHLSRANEHSALIEAGSESAVVFMGEHGYISSSWYPANPVRDSAPTWNFSVVHCHGRLQALDRAGTLDHLRSAVSHLERGRVRPWKLEELGDAGIERRLAGIVGFTIPIDRLEAKFKLGQDERLPDTCAAIERLKLEGGCPLAEQMEQKNACRAA